MKKKRHINFLGIALLLVYAFTMLPSIVMHHHHHEEVVAFSEADSCEKSIYYGIHDEHKEHISKTLEDCWFCDHHTMPLQILVENEFELLNFEISTEYSTYYKSFHSIELTGSSNKDPPFFI
ncbi:MAG: hypothetical protein LC107_05570 [Chitinophagales bacterium]|nr:hypothetical protein [Chitinophagales bacterium]